MERINKLSTIIIIFIICLLTFFSGFTKGSYFVYADSSTDNWTQVTTNEQLVEAFRYYCKSRDLTIEGSIADGVTSFTTKTFNGICNALGIDVTALQAHLKYETDGNLGTRFLFDTVGINAYNQIFAQFLQDNELEVGDSVNDIVEEQRYIDGYLITIFDNSGNVSQIGDAYQYTAGSIISTFSNGDVVSFLLPNGSTFNSVIFNKNLYGSKKLERYYLYVGNVSTIKCYLNYQETETNINTGYPSIGYNTYNHKYYLGGLNFFYNGRISFSTITEITDITPTINNISIVSNNINNNNYEGDTVINNDGDVINNYPDNPTPTPEPDYQPAEDWDVDLPDLSIPNWIISGKENKFPFDIPFNVMYALSLLQAEPEAPELEGTLDFGFYEWEYDLDLSDFDPVAEICRDMEVLAFITGLMLMTRKLIWG